MSMKVTTVGVVVAAALILVPYGASDTRERTQPVVPAAAPVKPAEATVGKVIAAQGNAALVQIRAEATQVAPPDLSQVAVDGRSE